MKMIDIDIAEAKRIVATWNYMSSKKTRREKNESSAKFCELVGFFPQTCLNGFTLENEESHAM